MALRLACAPVLRNAAFQAAGVDVCGKQTLHESKSNRARKLLFLAPWLSPKPGSRPRIFLWFGHSVGAPCFSRGSCASAQRKSALQVVGFSPGTFWADGPRIKPPMLHIRRRYNIFCLISRVVKKSHNHRRHQAVNPKQIPSPLLQPAAQPFKRQQSCKECERCSKQTERHRGSQAL